MNPEIWKALEKATREEVATVYGLFGLGKTATSKIYARKKKIMFFSCFPGAKVPENRPIIIDNAEFLEELPEGKVILISEKPVAGETFHVGPMRFEYFWKLSGKGLKDALTFYGTFGGFWITISQVKWKKALQDNVETVYSENSIAFEAWRRHFSNTTEMKIVRAVAQGARTVREIAEKVGIRRTSLPKYLNSLVERGILIRLEGKQSGYFVKDPYHMHIFLHLLPGKKPDERYLGRVIEIVLIQKFSDARFHEGAIVCGNTAYFVRWGEKIGVSEGRELRNNGEEVADNVVIIGAKVDRRVKGVEKWGLKELERLLSPKKPPRKILKLPLTHKS